MIESADDDAAVGKVGEVSRFQIKPWIWKLYSPVEDYRNPSLASYVAEKHLTSLEQSFRKRARREPTDFDLYVLWNAGPTYYGRINFSSGRVHPIIRDRAQRYANLREARNLQSQPILAQIPPQNAAPQTNRLVGLTTGTMTGTVPALAAQPQPSAAVLRTAVAQTFQSSTAPGPLPALRTPAESGPKQGILAIGGIPAK